MVILPLSKFLCLGLASYGTVSNGKGVYELTAIEYNHRDFNGAGGRGVEGQRPKINDGQGIEIIYSGKKGDIFPKKLVWLAGAVNGTMHVKSVI